MSYRGTEIVTTEVLASDKIRSWIIKSSKFVDSMISTSGTMPTDFKCGSRQKYLIARCYHFSST